jgi:hypothetical protein
MEYSIKDPPVSIFLFFYLFYFPLSSSTSNSLLPHAPPAPAPPAPCPSVAVPGPQLRCPPAPRDDARPQPLAPSPPPGALELALAASGGGLPCLSFRIASSNSGRDRLRRPGRWWRWPGRVLHVSNLAGLQQNWRLKAVHKAEISARQLLPHKYRSPSVQPRKPMFLSSAGRTKLGS